MNRFLLISALALLGTSAQAKCLGEAQIIAKAGELMSKSSQSCTLSVSEVRFYNESYDCPLYLEEVAQKGVTVGLDANQNCQIQAGGDINGILFLTDKNQIELY